VCLRYAFDLCRGVPYSPAAITITPFRLYASGVYTCPGEGYDKKSLPSFQKFTGPQQVAESSILPIESLVG
jgi:hypothetical protein